MSHAELEAVESATSVSFVCEDCGRVHNRNNPPCNDCGSMNLSAAADEDVDDTQEIDEEQSWRIVRDASRGITGLGVFVYLVGTLTLLVGVATLALGGVVYGNLLPGGWLVGIAWTVAGLLTIPIVRWRIEDRVSTHLSSRAVLGCYLALVGGSFALAAAL